MKVCVLGATGKTGRYLVERLCDEGHEVTAIGRDAERLGLVDGRAGRAVADLARPETVSGALRGGECVVSLAHARFTGTVLAALPECCKRVVLTGSTRRFTSLSDPAAEAVRTGEAAFLGSGRPGVMLHPSMIYGAPDDRNVNRILRYLGAWPRWLPALVPLPGGGRSLVQPVLVDDVVAAFAAAVTRPEAPGEPIVVAGPEPMTYADMVRACARALGRRVIILPLPPALLAVGLRLAGALGLGPPVNVAELGRAGEDKVFDTGAMRRRLGVVPRPFEEGLRLKISRGWAPRVR